jgi:nitrate/TMAO reductase-like tetraheme cytochrome c subunit
MKRIALLALLPLLGAFAVVGLDWALEVTSRNEFCYSCHSHDAFIRPVYEASSHFRNASGVRATCADCHLPHGDRLALIGAKLAASADVVGELRGELATREKYVAARERMANRVWRQFESDDSRLCRGCHDRSAMSAEAQSPLAARVHAGAAATGRTCIACHAGIVHGPLPGSVAARADSRRTGT